MIVRIDYTNPWIAKKRTLTLDVAVRGEGTFAWEGDLPVGVANALLSAPVKPWGRAATHPLSYPVKPA